MTASSSVEKHAATNPFFMEPQSSAELYQPSTSHETFSVENPTFDSKRGTLIHPISMPSIGQNRSHTFFTRFTHCLRRNTNLMTSSASSSSDSYSCVPERCVDSASMSMRPSEVIDSAGMIRSQSDNALDIEGSNEKPAKIFLRSAALRLRSHGKSKEHTVASTDASFREPDCDSIGSASSLEIVVQ